MNMYDFTCDFVRTGPNLYRCQVCNLEVSSVGIDKPMMICPAKTTMNNPANYGVTMTNIADPNEQAPPTQPPPLLNKVLNFTKAASQHALRGSPKCTDDQIQERYNICLSCEHFQNNTCSKCGCTLMRERAYMNKLAWADQSCPVGKWGPIK